MPFHHSPIETNPPWEAGGLLLQISNVEGTT